MKCPVCQTSNSDHVSNCIECNSDLEAYSQINFLDDQIKTKTRIVMALGAFLGALVLSGAFLFMNMSSTETTDNTSEDINKYKGDVIILEAQVKDLNSQLSKAESKLKSLESADGDSQGAQETAKEGSEPMSKTHTVQEGESLWSISSDHYGDGNKYTQIVQQNQITDPNLIVVGLTLTL